MLTVLVLALRNFNHFNKIIQTFFLSIDHIKARFSLKVKENYCCSIKIPVLLFMFPPATEKNIRDERRTLAPIALMSCPLIYWKEFSSMHRQNFSLCVALLSYQ